MLSQDVLILGPHPMAKGGIARVIASHIDILTSHEDLPSPILLPTYSEGSSFVKTFSFFSALFRLITLHASPLFAHLHVASRTSFHRKYYLARILWRKRIPYIAHLHGGAFADFFASSGPTIRRHIHTFFDRATKVVVLTEKWRNTLTGLLETDITAKTMVIPNPVTIPPTISWEAKSYSHILFLGRIVPDKGIALLLESFASVHKNYPDLSLTIAGDGQVAGVRNQAVTLGIQHAVHTPGWIEGPQKDSLLRTAGIFVLPSYQEGLPISILEAMAHGNIVIASAVGGVPELIGDRYGLLIPPRDKLALVTALNRVIANPSWARTIGHAARLRVLKEYSPTAISRYLRHLYQRDSLVS